VKVTWCFTPNMEIRGHLNVTFCLFCPVVISVNLVSQARACEVGTFCQ